MVDLKELDQFIKEYGKNGMRFLLLFSLLKSKTKVILRQHPDIREERLDRACAAKADEMLKLGKNQPTEKDIKELLSHIRKSQKARMKSSGKLS